MFCQNSTYNDVSSNQQGLKAPIGSGLAGATPSLTPNDGSIALNLTNNKLYYAGNNTWNAINAGDVVGPASATDNAVARFDGTTGKLIQNSQVIISDAGAVTGVSTLNGEAPLVTLAAFGSTPNANGASISNQVITLQPASATQPGGVSTSAQTFNGVKTFDDGIIITPTVTSGLVNTSTQHYFHNVGAVTFTGAAALSSSLMVQRSDSFAWLAFSTSNSVAGAGGILTMSPVLATEFRPGTGPGRHGYVNVINNGTPGIGSFMVATDGTVTIGKSLGAGSALVAFDAGVTQILDCTGGYTLA